jgi:hypothetical protein
MTNETTRDVLGEVDVRLSIELDRRRQAGSNAAAATRWCGRHSLRRIGQRRRELCPTTKWRPRRSAAQPHRTGRSVPSIWFEFAGMPARWLVANRSLSRGLVCSAALGRLLRDRLGGPLLRLSGGPRSASDLAALV